MVRARSFLPLLAVAGLTLAGGCGDDEDQWPVVFTDPGERFEVDAGEQFTVVLESNATTGYAWALEAEPPREVVRLVDDVYVEPDTDLVGAPGRQELTFEAVGDGSTYLQLWYVRSFDDPPEPADRAQFEVIVGSGDPGGTVPPGDIDEPVDPAPDDEDAISVTELLASMPDGEVVVTGMLFDDGSGLVLCGVLAESYPPQCVGDRVPIADPDNVVADFTVAEGVRWTDRPVTVRAHLVDGMLVLA